MSLSLLDSPLWQDLYGSAMAADHLGDPALIAAMIRGEIALAEACDAGGLVPPGSGARIARALAQVQIAPESLAAGAARDGVVVPALLEALRARLTPADAEALHWGATSQDIVDTATALCLRDFARNLAVQTETLLDRLGALAGSEAETLCLARTRTQGAVPTTFGASVAVWGAGLDEARARLAQAAREISRVSLHGAAGNDGVLGSSADDLRAGVAERLGLTTDPVPWHSQRGPVTHFADAVTAVASAAGRIGAELAFLAATGIGEVRLAGGGSSAMPHKANPVRLEAALSLARFAPHLQAAVSQAALHGSQRDGAAWGLEWLALRPLCATSAAALENIALVLASMQPDRAAMARNLQAAGLAPFSERLTYLIAPLGTRAAARDAIRDALATEAPLATLRERYPELDWQAALDPLAAAGNAPRQAREFAASRETRS